MVDRILLLVCYQRQLSARNQLPDINYGNQFFQTIRNSRTLAALLLAIALTGCVKATFRPAAQPAAPLPGPGRALVYDFGAAAHEMELHRGSARNDLG